MIYIRVCFTVSLFLAFSSAYGGPAVQQCEPEFSTFLALFGETTGSAAIAKHPFDQFRCPEVDSRQILVERDWVLVDTRPEKEFDALHIPGSLNVGTRPTLAISHFRDRNILLVNKGSRRFSSLQLCQEMKSKGFERVSILSGGINGWIAAGAPYNGNASGLRNAFLLTEREISFLLQNKQIQILYIKPTPATQGTTYILQQHAHAQSDGQHSDVLLKLNQLSAKGEFPVLMVGDDAINDKVIDRYMNTKSSNVYFLASGAHGFDRFFHDWKSSLSSKNASDNMSASCF